MKLIIFILCMTIVSSCTPRITFEGNKLLLNQSIISSLKEGDGEKKVLHVLGMPENITMTTNKGKLYSYSLMRKEIGWTYTNVKASYLIVMIDDRNQIDYIHYSIDSGLEEEVKNGKN